MNIVALLLMALTIGEIYFIGFGMTLLLLLPSRIGYMLNTFAFSKKVKTCVKWEALAIGWVILKTLVFKSLYFSWKRMLILTVFGLVALLIEFYDETQNVYIIEDIKEEKKDIIDEFKE